MVGMDRAERIEQGIVDQCELLLASDAFGVWKGSESVRPGDLIAVNNSFLYREKRATSKNARYLGIRVSEDGGFVFPPSVLSTKSRINLQFKRLQPKELSKYEVCSLADSITEELSNLGSIVFSLVGRIGEAGEAEVEIPTVPGIRMLRYVPGQAETMRLADEVVSFGDISTLDACWSAISSTIEEDVDLEKLGNIFEFAFHELQEAAACPIDVGEVSEEGPSILGNMVIRIEEQVDAFSKALEAHINRPADNEAYNELLRISYNFADGARVFLGLMVGVCDLKPLIFWLTVFDQVELAHCFSQLPFSLVGTGKPSLERYRSVIADARNQAFHDLFAFDHPFKVDLRGDALRGPQLHLFREYGKRNDPALTFEDRGLVELLQGLTRTSERPVPLGFWDGNHAIMRAVVGAVRSLRHALVLVFE